MEMKCIVCDKVIPKGQRFVGNRYKAEKFCCEECYNQFCKDKDEAKELAKAETAERHRQQEELKRQQAEAKKKPKEKIPGWRKMTDYINELYPPDTINWPMFTKQIKAIMEEYELTCDDIRLTIKYAIEFGGHITNPDWGIGQFIPAYIEPTRYFREKLHHNRDIAKNIDKDNIPVVYIKKSASNKKYFGKLEEFDDVE